MHHKILVSIDLKFIFGEFDVFILHSHIPIHEKITPPRSKSEFGK